MNMEGFFFKPRPVVPVDFLQEPGDPPELIMVQAICLYWRHLCLTQAAPRTHS